MRIFDWQDMAESNGAGDVCFDVNIEIEDVQHEEQNLSRPKVVEKYRRK